MRTEHVHRTGFSASVPKPVSRRGHWFIHLVLAAHDFADLGAVGEVVSWPNAPGRYGVHLHGRWYLTFFWEALVGAYELKLERR